MNILGEVNSELQELKHHPFVSRGIKLFVQREDQIHPEISGNKWRKLKYNIRQAQEENKGILTFGGAYSNHISAVAAACREYNIPSIGIIRGDELNKGSNATLKKAYADGMKLDFVSRHIYAKRYDKDYLFDIKNRYKQYFIVPEGGANSLGARGCQEILQEEFDYVFCSCGTASTLAGLINSQKAKKFVGVSALKGDFLKNEILKWTDKRNWDVFIDYHFGGYGKIKPELIEFIHKFWKDYQILLDPVYTGKTFYAAFDFLSKKTELNKIRINLIHTGGLQGWKGYKKFLPSGVTIK